MSDTKAEEDKVAKGNDVEPISSTIRAIADDSYSNKDNSIISSRTVSISVVPEGLEKLRPKPAIHTPLVTRTLPFVPISTELNRVVNEDTPPAFVTPKRKAKRVAFTVEDYLKSLTETQRMKLIEKTNQKIETLLELKRQAQEIISSIPII